MKDYEPGIKLEVLIPDGDHILNPVKIGLEERGFKPVRQRQNGHLLIEVANPPVIFMAQGSREIPRLVDHGIYALGIVGEDRLEEYRVFKELKENNPPSNIVELGRLEVFHPRLKLTLLTRNNPVDFARYMRPEDLKGQRVVTTYPGMTERFFRQYFPNPREAIQLDEQVDGKEEIQVWSHRAEGCVVIVDEGEAMRSWKLRDLLAGGEPIMSGIQPVLIGNPNALQEGIDYLETIEPGSGEVLFGIYEQFMTTFRGSERLNGKLSHLPVLEPQIPAAS